MKNSLTVMEKQSPTVRSVDTSFYLSIYWILCLLAASFGPVLWRLGRLWFNQDSDMTHGIMAPVAAGYMAWLKRDSLRDLSPEPTRWGLILVFWATLQVFVSLSVDWLFGSQVALLI